MNIFELKIWDDERKYCSFYTVAWDETEQNETDKFFLRFEEPENPYFEESNIILSLVLNSIGDKYGAIDAFFDRTKNKAQALPPKPKRRIPEIEEIGTQFPLRLYCYRINEQIVVLFNGGIKEARTDQETDDSIKFYEALQFATKIEQAINDGTIIVAEDGRTLTDYKGNSEIIL